MQVSAAGILSAVVLVLVPVPVLRLVQPGPLVLKKVKRLPVEPPWADHKREAAQVQQVDMSAAMGASAPEAQKSGRLGDGLYCRRRPCNGHRPN